MMGNYDVRFVKGLRCSLHFFSYGCVPQRSAFPTGAVGSVAKEAPACVAKKCSAPYPKKCYAGRALKKFAPCIF
jgi:hypothetical protein